MSTIEQKLYLMWDMQNYRNQCKQFNLSKGYEAISYKIFTGSYRKI